ncbi:MAG: ATP-binding protein [Ktedonobacteraceae bacterium]|nr:ATP-binding protein [Ktedonobacteraceae bacterium]MBV9022060.1 ATP-binding protein [Ktedonobacteraceae bacterium]
MESLNDIISRTGLQRQRLTVQRSQQGNPPTQRPQPLNAHRRLREQTARMDQQEDMLSPLSQLRHTAPSTTQPYQRHPQQRPRPLQEGRQYSSAPQPYHRSDNYTSTPRADALEEWDEDEDGTTGMRYGDWERVEELPEPPTPTRAAKQPRYPRQTRPLDPQVVANIGRGGEPLPELLRPTQVASREPPQVAVHEQVLQYAAVNVPPPMPARQVCPLCRGAGYLRNDVPVGHPFFGKPIECECKVAEKKEKRRQQLLELSDLAAFRHISFKNFHVNFPGMHPSVREAFQEASHFARNPNGWLVLVGNNGCGKTHLAAAIANQCLQDGAVVLFTVVPDLLAHLRATFSPNSTEAYDVRFAKMREAELLVLDDLGAHQSSPWANEKLFQLLNYRYNTRYPTVITANASGLASVDERIISRLSDRSLVTTVVLNGAQDYRRQNPRRDLLGK